MNKSKNVIDVLKQDVDSKLNYQDLLIEIKNLYVVLLENNTSLICEECFEKLNECQIATLYNFFNGEKVSTKTVNGIKTDHLCNSEPFYTNNGLRGIAIPIKMFLNNHAKKGMVTEKNVITVYNIVNEYIKINPTFANEIFEEKRSNKQI